MNTLTIPESGPSAKTPEIDFKGLLTFRFPFVDLLPPLDPDEVAALREDIRTRTILQPPVVHETDDVGVYDVLDGANRVRLGVELGLDEIPFKLIRGLDPDQQRELALDLNLHRRHLTREQRREIIARRLKADPDVSDRAIATQVKVDHKTVAVVREELEAGGEIPHRAARFGKNGVTQKKAKPTPEETEKGIKRIAKERKAEEEQQRVERVIAAQPADPLPGTDTRVQGSIDKWSDLAYVASLLGQRVAEAKRLAKYAVPIRRPEPVLQLADEIQRHANAIRAFALTLTADAAGVGG